MANNYDNILEKIALQPTLPVLRELLENDDPEFLKALSQYAYRIKTNEMGRKVYFRGIIEFSNICTKDCYYCGIRKSNQLVSRYELTEEEILREARWCYENDYGSLVLQAGERRDPAFVDKVETLLKEIKSLSKGTLGITLSVGEQDQETYSRWFHAGAHRYLLRIETSNPDLYAALHPHTHSWEERKRCLEFLRRSGYQVGTGFLIGVPGQTPDDMARDILFLKEMDIDMVGMGPFIPHEETPLGSTASFEPVRQLTMGLKMIALVRIILKDVNIAATTALQALSPAGRELGLRAGANIIMPNVTDLAYRKGYQLYNNKPSLDENAEEQRINLEQAVKALGEKVCYGEWGDSLHFKKRQNW